MSWGGFSNQNTSPKNTKTWDPFKRGSVSGVPGGGLGRTIEDNHGRPKTVAGVNKISSQILEDSVLGDAAKRYGTKRVKGMS